MLVPLLLGLLALGDPPRNLTVEELDDGRFRLTIVFVGGSPEVHAHMQFRLMEQAARLCRGRGRPVSDGALQLDAAPRGRLALSETYSCRAD